MEQKHPCSNEVKEGGGEGAGLEDEHLRDTVPAEEVTLPGVNREPAVNWEPVDRLGQQNKPYIDFPGIIKQERLPSLFPSLTVFAGGISTELPPNESARPQMRVRVYFEGSDPARPHMRVAQQLDDDGRVRRTYSWERVNFVYKEMGERSCMCYIYTPANLNSYGLVVDFDTKKAEAGEVYEVYFKETGPGVPKDEVTLFQLGNTDQDTVTITVVNRRDIGLYVDTDDGGKVKATRDQQRWSRFTIDRFLPQTA